jgi:hypothetical protein
VSTTPAGAGASAQTVVDARHGPIKPAVVSYFFSDGTRTVQSVLGLIWLLDGALQLQSFMYSRAFTEMITSMASGQPGWLASSMRWGANLEAHNMSLYNTAFALIQLIIGLGLLYRPAVKHALILSFAWALFVWWFGEGFGMLFMNMAQPLTGAPGCILYVLVGLMVWPNGKPGGLLGIRGARVAWATLWLLMAALWLLQSSSSANAINTMINAAPSGMSWLSSLQDGFASIFALLMSALSATIAVGVGLNRSAKPLLALATVISLLYWLVGQGFGGMFQGRATDPNMGPLFILLAYAIYLLVPYELQTSFKLEPQAT